MPGRGPALLDGGGGTLNFPQLWAIVHIHEKFFIFYAQLRMAMRKFSHGHEQLLMVMGNFFHGYEQLCIGMKNESCIKRCV